VESINSQTSADRAGAGLNRISQACLVMTTRSANLGLYRGYAIAGYHTGLGVKPKCHTIAPGLRSAHGVLLKALRKAGPRSSAASFNPSSQEN
jgi:hypothetical protein